MSILSPPSFEVKEISAKSEAFQAAPAHQVYVEFRDMPHARTGETPYTQPRQYGALVAVRVLQGMGNGKPSGTSIANVT